MTTTHASNGEPAADHPREGGPKPPFPPQPQGFPSSETRMRPRPDHGEATYRGSGRLLDRAALVTELWRWGRVELPVQDHRTIRVYEACPAYLNISRDRTRTDALPILPDRFT